MEGIMLHAFPVAANILLAAMCAIGEPTVHDVVTPQLESFSLRQVRLLEGRLLTEQERDRAYLHELDVDRLLHSFRKTAGLPTPGEPYGGWESPECEGRGHFVGHFLSACAMMYAGAGDEELKAKGDVVVAELAKCQQALGGEYLSAFPESFFDRLEAGQPVQVPYYAIHKIMAGLYDMHTLCGNEQARGVMEGLAAFVKRRIEKLPPDSFDRMLRAEFGGMSEALHNLYSLTGNPEHLALANRFDQGEFLGPLALGWDNLTRIHGNTQIPKIIGAARRYELTGDERYKNIAALFWTQVAEKRSYATGGSTLYEIWPEPEKLADSLGGLNHETCKTHNMLKLTRHLLEWTGDVRYADFYERALLNGILGTQGDKPGEFQYYVAMGTGYPRVFGTPDNSFWCCYGTGIESFSKLGDSIYFHHDKDLYVNLFVSSTLDWPEMGARVEQHADFPSNDKLSLALHLKKSKKFAVNIRAPYWIAEQPEVWINGKKTDMPKIDPASWVKLKRLWKDGDRVEIRLPMNLHSMKLPDDSQMAAFMYGPYVLAGIVDTCPKRKDDVTVHPIHDAISLFQKDNITNAGWFVGNPDAPEKELKMCAKSPLCFQTVPPFAAYIPFCDVLKDRYRIYNQFVSENSEKREELFEKSERECREIDRVYIFPREVDKTCSERRHNFKGECTNAGCSPSKAFLYRDGGAGGWFGWDFDVKSDKKMELIVTYWGGDANRTFDIEVDGQLLATETLKGERPEKTIDVIYPLPESMTSGKSKISVVFRGNHGTTVGGVFGCATLTAK
jgi:DUF1680 family protein